MFSVFFVAIIHREKVVCMYAHDHIQCWVQENNKINWRRPSSVKRKAKAKHTERRRSVIHQAFAAHCATKKTEIATAADDDNHDSSTAQQSTVARANTMWNNYNYFYYYSG